MGYRRIKAWCDVFLQFSRQALDVCRRTKPNFENAKTFEDFCRRTKPNLESVRALSTRNDRIFSPCIYEFCSFPSWAGLRTETTTTRHQEEPIQVIGFLLVRPFR